MLTLEIDDRAIMARLSSMPDKLRAALLKKTYSLAEKLKSKVQQNLTNKLLNIRTGKLVRSIFEEVKSETNSISGRVYSSGLKYAAIQEFGGTIDHPGGTAYIPTKPLAVFISNAKAQVLAAKFESGDLPRTRPHKITIPPHHYMGSAFEEMKPEIKNGYEQAVKDAAKL